MEKTERMLGAKEAFETGKKVREVALAEGIMPEERINEILDGIITGKGKD